MKLPVTDEEMESLYNRYVQPFEGQHRGRLVAVCLDGRVLLGNDELQLFQRHSINSVAATL